MKTNDEVTALRRRVGVERRASGGGPVRYSRELRRDLLALLDESELTQTGLAAAVGISASVIQNWRKSPSGEAGALQRVQVTALPEPSSDGIELVFPSGAKVRGLTLAQVAALLESQA